LDGAGPSEFELLQAANLRFGYTSALVVDDVSIDVGRRALVGVLGPNGSGKTTLLRLLAGTLRPQSGRVTLDGADLTRIPRAAVARRLAVVPQETQLAFEYTALEIALMGRYAHLRAFEVEGPADLASANAALDATGTRELGARPFNTLSGGEKQRVVIASALAQLNTRASSPTPQTSSPGRLLFLDEPTASLDLHYQVEMANVIRRLHDEQDISIVLSTHDLHFAAAVCEDVILLRRGRVLARGATADVLTPAALAELYDLQPEVVAAWSSGVTSPVRDREGR